MRKSDKKIDNNLRQVLTEACEVATEDIPGFQWLTHFANYDKFPASLAIVCVFESNEQLDEARRNGRDVYLQGLIKHKLAEINITISNIRKQVTFDTEENCSLENDGRWQDRFN